MEKLAIKVFTGIIYPSNWLKNKLSKRLKGKNRYVIKNMLREQKEDNICCSKQNFGLLNDVPIIISYNPMRAPHNKKAFELYLETIKRIVFIKKDIQFILIGVSENAIDFVSKAVNDLPVCIVSCVKNIFRLFALVDVFLLFR